jgi:hypothetical protein
MLTFSEWDKLNSNLDESLKDNVKNWLSRTFGGKVSKIDGILSELVSLEKDFAKEWEKIQMSNSNIRSQIETGEISHSEEEDFLDEIKKKEKELASLERTKIQRIRDLNIKVLEMTKENPRLTKYWNMKKAEAEVEVAENLYNISKSLPDKKLEDQLYKDYLKTYDSYKSKKKEMDEFVHHEEEEGEKEKEVKKESIPGAKELIQMNLSQFIKEIKTRDKEDVRKIHRMLIDQKNIAMNELRALRRSRAKEMDRVSPKEREKAGHKFNPKIYEVGEFVDKIRDKINHIGG